MPGAVCLVVLVVCGLSAQQANPLAAFPYIGTFENDQMTLTLQRREGMLTGAIEFGGQTYPVRANLEDGKLAGVFGADGAEFSFSAQLEGESLQLESGGAAYTLRKKPAGLTPQATGTPVQSIQAVADSPPETAAPAEPAPPAANQGAPAKILHKHPLGFTLQTPAGWRFLPQQEAGALIPAGAEFDPASADNREVYFVSALEQQFDPRDITLLPELSQNLQGVGVSSNQTPQIDDFTAGTKDARCYTWEFPHPTLGKPFRVQLFLVGTAVRTMALLAAGERDLVAARQEQVREVAATLSFHPETAQAAQPAQTTTEPGAAQSGGALTDSAPQSKAWLNRLLGMLLTQVESDYDASGGYSSRTRIYLAPDGSFGLGHSDSSSVSAGGGGAAIGGTGQMQGRWRIATQEGATYLILKPHGGPNEEWNLLQNNGAETYINEKRTYVTPPQ